MGFGAERANLMDEAPVNMDNVHAIQAEKEIPGTISMEESKGMTAKDARLEEKVN